MDSAGAPDRPEATLAAFVRGLKFDDLPADVVEPIEKAVIDTMGVTLAGSVEGAGKRLVDWGSSVSSSPDAAGLAAVLDLSTPDAGLVLGTSSHGLDYDDLSWGMSGHPSVVLVPALLALADSYDLSGQDVITAYAGGFETMCAIAAPISPEHYERGWHATATFGTFGATAAAAVAMGLDEPECRTAFNMAASMASGLKQNFGSMTKPLHAGLATRSGITAASLAEAGVTADSSAISGDRGFWDVYGENPGTSFSIGDNWYLLEHGIHIKTYPCCYFTHTSIAAVQELRQTHDIEPSDITSIEVVASRGAGDALQYPTPETTLEAKFSMEYTVACALAHGDVTLDQFEENALNDPVVGALRDRIQFSVDDELAYDEHTCTVRLKTRDQTIQTNRRNPPGTFDTPLSMTELRSKFMECATRCLSVDHAERTFDTLQPLTKCERVADILESV